MIKAAFCRMLEGTIIGTAVNGPLPTRLNLAGSDQGLCKPEIMVKGR
jgi:hypothetical protein